MSIGAAAKSFKLASLGALLALTGCAATKPETAQVVSQPRTPAIRNITSFSGALRCMDDLFVRHGVRDIFITSAGVPDATGEIATGTREMLISAVSRMSARSGGFRYVDYDPRQIDVHELHQLIDSSGAFLAPNYYIRGAITQLDEGVVDASAGFGFSLPEFNFGINKNQVISLVTLDLNVADFVSRQILPGLSANNSLAVVRTGRAADAGGRIKKAGLFFNIALDQSEGVHQAVRTLVELGAIELLGKLAQVPYWTCLQIESTNPLVRAEASDWYHGMTPSERSTFVQRALKGGGYYAGPISGRIDAATSDAIGAYQAEQGLVPSGRVDFQLYLALLDTNKRLAGKPSIAAGYKAPDAAIQQARQQVEVRRPVTIALLTDRGAKPVYSPSEQLNMQVQLSRNAYLYCYYRDAQGLIARIYPNRFQPDAYVPSDKPLAVPAPNAPFQIRFDKPGAREEVLCFSSDRELALHLPTELKTADLQPLPLASVDDLIKAYKAIDKNALAIARVPITVR